MIDEFFKQRLRVKGRCNSLIVGIYFSWKSPTLECSTIGAVALNDAVRKGKRGILNAVITKILRGLHILHFLNFIQNTILLLKTVIHHIM